MEASEYLEYLTFCKTKQIGCKTGSQMINNLLRILYDKYSEHRLKLEELHKANCHKQEIINKLQEKKKK